MIDTAELVDKLADSHGGRILDALKTAPDGMTDFELSASLGIFLSSVNAARNSLMNAGLVRARGGMAKVWVAR